MNEYLKFYLDSRGIDVRAFRDTNEYLDAINNTDRWSRGSEYIDKRAFQARDEGIAKYGFAIPTDRALATIAKCKSVIEIGAGHGYWASLLQKRFDVDVTCFDECPVGAGDNAYFRTIQNAYHPVLRGLEDVVRHYSSSALLLIWPPYADSMAANCLREYRGEDLFYVGEYDGGCTGDGEFHAMLDYEWTEVECVSIPQWWGIHDALWHYKRGRSPKLFVPSECSCESWSKRACVRCWDEGIRVSRKWGSDE